MRTIESPPPLRVLDKQNDTSSSPTPEPKLSSSTLQQFLRFVLVGGMNTAIDLLLLNCLLWLWPTQNTAMLLLDNSIAYAFGGVNSFMLNKYWTFQLTGRTNTREVSRFVLTTLAGIACNDIILWFMSSILHPVLLNATLWANVSKILAISGTVTISYLGMHLWVFVRHAQKEHITSDIAFQRKSNKAMLDQEAFQEHVPQFLPTTRRLFLTTHTLSVVLPAYNEEHAIASTIEQILSTLTDWVSDFEVIVINDGSTDRTRAIVTAIGTADPRVRLVTHEHNQGYGAALADGFAAATKELTFFMDADGQFDISDLRAFLLFIDDYNAVIGYRIDRQDSWMRKLNAWGWKHLISWVLGVHVRDVDCAFKLLHTDFFRQHPLETRGAMINAEMLYKLTRAGYTYKELGVHHLPRQAGRATGAHLRVILRAFRELFVYARKWHREE